MRDSLQMRRLKNKVSPYVLALPAFVLIAVFLYGVIVGVLQGFGIMPFLGQTQLTFEYWAKAFSRADFLSSLGFSFWISLSSAGIALVGGCLLAWALCAVKAKRAFQLLDLQIPIMTAHMLVVLATVSLFAGSGLFPRLLSVFGIVDGPSAFSSVLGASSGWGIILVYAWKEIPFVAFCTVTIMRNVSDSLGEAATTLGATSTKAFFQVILPLSKGPLIKAFLVVFAFALGSYEVPFLLGPTLHKALPVLAYLEFTSPDIANRCYAMAINGIMVLITTLIALLYFLVLRREDRKRV